MSLFDDVPAAPEPRRRLPRRASIGVWALAVALVALLVLTFLPTAYVIQQQGPVVNTLGSASDGDGEDVPLISVSGYVSAPLTEMSGTSSPSPSLGRASDGDGEDVPLISVSGAETYPAEGALDLTTVQVRGNRESTPSWFELAMAWFDTSKAVLPIEQIYPEGTTTEQRNEESAALMVDSQKEATAAALTELGYDVSPYVAVFGFSEDSPAAGVLEEGDVIVSANDRPITTTTELREEINAGEGDPVSLVVRRDDEERTVEITPRENVTDGETSWIIGVTTSHDYDFPIEVTIQLDRIGGPSAGQMFALGIIDVLTPGELTGGEHIAGTGTIDAAGAIGPIGGIRQKLHGADDAGAEWFFAPADNCDEVAGHVPGDLQVVAVATLDDSLAALEAISSGEGVDDLPACR